MVMSINIELNCLVVDKMARVNILLNFEHFISTRVKFNIIQFPFKGDDIRKFHTVL